MILPRAHQQRRRVAAELNEREELRNRQDLINDPPLLEITYQFTYHEPGVK